MFLGLGWPAPGDTPQIIVDLSKTIRLPKIIRLDS